MNNSYPIKEANELDDISYSFKIKRNSVSYLIQSNIKSENPELSNDIIYNILCDEFNNSTNIKGKDIYL